MRDWADIALLGEPALQRIAEAARIPIAAPENVKSACYGLLEGIARRAILRAFDGGQLSKRHDLEPLLKAWRRWRETHSVNASKRLSNLVARMDDNRFGPVPPPQARPEAFESWLADMSLAHQIPLKLMEDCLTQPELLRAIDKASRVAAARHVVQLAQSPRRDLVSGGRPVARERDHRTELLLAVYWLLFAEKPNASIADTHLRPRNEASEAVAADGGAAVRFIVSFENEIAAAIAKHEISDPLRKKARPCRWEPRSEHSVSQHIERIIERDRRIWEKWTLQMNSDGSPAPMLVLVS